MCDVRCRAERATASEGAWNEEAIKHDEWPVGAHIGRRDGLEGSSTAFASAAAVILVWAVLGPVFSFSDTWQLIIKLERPSSRHGVSYPTVAEQGRVRIHLKLNELVAALEGANNRLIDATGALLDARQTRA